MEGQDLVHSHIRKASICRLFDGCTRLETREAFRPYPITPSSPPTPYPHPFPLTLPRPPTYPHFHPPSHHHSSFVIIPEVPLPLISLPSTRPSVIAEMLFLFLFSLSRDREGDELFMLDAIRSRLLFQQPFAGAATHPCCPPLHLMAPCYVRQIRVGSFWKDKRGGGDVEEMERKERLFFFFLFSFSFLAGSRVVALQNGTIKHF